MADPEAPEAPEHHAEHAGPVAGAGHVLTRRLGPLPAWGWGVAGVATAGLFLYLKSRAALSSAAATTAPVDSPTSASPAAAGGTFPGPAIGGTPASGAGILDPGSTAPIGAPWAGAPWEYLGSIVQFGAPPSYPPTPGSSGAAGPTPANRSGAITLGAPSPIYTREEGGGITVTNTTGVNDQGIPYGVTTPQDQAQAEGDALAAAWNASH